MPSRGRFRWTSAALLGAAALTIPGRAWANDCGPAFAAGAFACVAAILEPRPDTGAWDTASASYGVSIESTTKDVRPGPVSVGTALSNGDLVRTRRARVAVQLRNGGVARMADGTELRVGDTFDQLMGNVWYLLRSRTTVRYGAVKAAVEGTTFVVYSDANGTCVGVSEGVVLVGVGDDAQRVRSNQRIDVRNETLGQAKEWSEDEQYELSRAMWQAGHPTLVLGLSAGLGTAGRFFAPQVRANALLRLAGQIGVSTDASVTPWGEDGFRLVFAAGPRYFFTKLPPPAGGHAADWNQFVWHHASLGADVVSVVSPSAARAQRPQWGGAVSYDFAFPRRRLALLVQARLGVLEGPAVFWNFSYGIGIAL